jgi:hypothetical protein
VVGSTGDVGELSGTWMCFEMGGGHLAEIDYGLGSGIGRGRQTGPVLVQRALGARGNLPSGSIVSSL